MCGLFAGIGKLNSNRMIALGSMNEERGTDSVGIAYVNSERVLTIEKTAERPCVGLNISLKKAVTEAAVSGMFIGHTRQATKGKVTARNAHPFMVDDIAFAHNGIIFNDEDFGKYEVDSESLIHGIKAKDFSKYEGPIALVWIENGLLKAYRSGNPLARGKLGGVTYLASEKEYLEAIGCNHIKELAEGLIYTFHDSFKVTTERVPENKTYTTKFISNKAATGYTYQDYVDSEKTKWDEYDKMTASERQTQWYKDGNLEDFRTPSDIAKENSIYSGVCDACGEIGELTEGVCLDCIMELDATGEVRLDWKA